MESFPREMLVRDYVGRGKVNYKITHNRENK